MKEKNAWTTYTAKQLKELEALCGDYRVFLDEGKTERECIRKIIADAEAAGYKDLNGIIEAGKKVKAGDKVYSVCMNKTIALFNIGSAPLEKGMNILGAHIDSPRLDLKQNPLYEDTEIAYMDTHYYGGIKKYQWVTIPLAVHGVVAMKDGLVKEIRIGEDEKDPVVFVSDLLIHLAAKQMVKKASVVIEGEDLDIIVGSRPLKGEDKDAVKAGVLKMLKDSYGIEEDDLWSAELEIVPAGKAREAGLDRSMIMAYGQDDRVCAFTSLVSMLRTKKMKRTACCLLVDK
ncbi:MAG: aminopeptidase, partial [Firmicutes bacterium]|nr:aminopeptidase [Bacillota bacterium]